MRRINARRVSHRAHGQARNAPPASSLSIDRLLLGRLRWIVWGIPACSAGALQQTLRLEALQP